MNRDDVIRMAREARWIGNVEGWTFTSYEELEHFAKLVAAADREACARVCDTFSKRDDDMGAIIGRAIRARSEV